VETYINGRWISQDTTWDAGFISNDKFTFDLTQEYMCSAQNKYILDHLAAFVNN
jgi:hypothetical protein